MSAVTVPGVVPKEGRFCTNRYLDNSGSSLASALAIPA